MISQAKARFIRISPRKARYVIDLIRLKSVNQAFSILERMPKRASLVMKRLLASAVDAAVRNSGADQGSLYVSRVFADGAPMMKRFRAASMGRAARILKRTSHIHLELDVRKTKASVSSAGQAQAPAQKKVKKVLAQKA